MGFGMVGANADKAAAQGRVGIRSQFPVDIGVIPQTFAAYGNGLSTNI